MDKLSDPQTSRQADLAQGEPVDRREVQGPFDTLLPDGTEVLVSLQRVEQGKFRNDPRLFGHFVIVDGPYCGKALLRFWRPKVVGRTSNLVRDYLAVIGRHPKVNDLRPMRFLGECVVRAVALVVTKDFEGIPLLEGARYSRIGRIQGLESGTPPCLRRRAQSVP